MEGKVKFYDKVKGYGFIIPDNGGADVFVHVTGTKSELNEGDRVSFNIVDSPKGDKAVDVTVI